MLLPCSWLSVAWDAGQSGGFPEAHAPRPPLTGKREMNWMILVPSPRVMAALGRRSPALRSPEEEQQPRAFRRRIPAARVVGGGREEMGEGCHEG